jgi:F-type H+-transporting ATPase subunit epsilon
MATFHFDLVSPEELVFSGEVEHVVVPGTEGEFGVLAGHAPLIAMLRPGYLTILGAGPDQVFIVYGGFAEVSEAGLTVLADKLTLVADFDHQQLAADIKEAQEDVDDEKDGEKRDRLQEKLDRLKQLRETTGH